MDPHGSDKTFRCVSPGHAVCSEPVTVMFLTQRALPWNRPYHRKVKISLPVRDGDAVTAQQVRQFGCEISFTKASKQRPSPPPSSLPQPNSLKERSATGTPRRVPLLRQRKKGVRTAAQEHTLHMQGRSVLLQMVLRVMSTNRLSQSPRPPHHTASLKRHHRSSKRSRFPLSLHHNCQRRTRGWYPIQRWTRTPSKEVFAVAVLGPFHQFLYLSVSQQNQRTEHSGAQEEEPPASVSQYFLSDIFTEVENE